MVCVHYSESVQTSISNVQSIHKQYAKYNGLIWHDFQNHHETEYILWHCLPINTSKIFFWGPIFGTLVFLGTEYVSPVTTSYHTNSMKKHHLNSTFTNTAVTTTVGLPDLNLKWQLKNDGKASALSDLSLHLSMTHGSDCHCYLLTSIRIAA